MFGVACLMCFGFVFGVCVLCVLVCVFDVVLFVFEAWFVVF